MEKKKLSHFTIFFLKPTKNDYSKCSDENITKLGIILPKKTIKLSITRNLIKRWIKQLLNSSNLKIEIIIKANSPIHAKSKCEKNVIFNELKSLISLAEKDLS